MTAELPCASKQGAMISTTGPDPAGGCALGAVCWPHTRDRRQAGWPGAGSLDVSCAANGAAATKKAVTASRTQPDGHQIILD